MKPCRGRGYPCPAPERYRTCPALLTKGIFVGAGFKPAPTPCPSLLGRRAIIKY